MPLSALKYVFRRLLELTSGAHLSGVPADTKGQRIRPHNFPN